MSELEQPARDLAHRSISWLDECWDDSAGLVRLPAGSARERGRTGVVHLVRSTAWYAVGLLLRSAAGDHARAARAVASVLNYQFDVPGRPHHGTFYRSPDDPAPPEHPKVWRDYDPNWREFIGTSLALALSEYERDIPTELVSRIDAALRRAVAGAVDRGLWPSYTNIALMSAFLRVFAGERFDVSEWREDGERLATEVVARFRSGGAFDEYNCPTYYGVDLYALGLWRSYAPSAGLRERGAELEAALWRDIARYYHAGMRNLAGPYDRSYGMDMRRHLATLGLWIGLATGSDDAPLPDLDGPFEHAWDFGFAPLVALVGLRMPEDAAVHFRSFQGEREVEQVIASDPRRVATAWIGERAMLGGQDSGSRMRPKAQFHAATIHWLAGGEEVGWIRLRHEAPVDARAERNRLSIRCTEHPGGRAEFVFQIRAPAVEHRHFQSDRWELPDLTVQVDTNAPELGVTNDADLTELRYAVADAQPGAPVWFELALQAGGGDRPSAP